MQEQLLELMQLYGYWAVAALIFIENVFPPIPSEVVLLFAGFLTTQTKLGLPGMALAATAGALAGALVLYAVGRLLPEQRLKHILSGNIGKLLHLYPEDVDKAAAWFARYGGKAVLLCRCVPIVRSLISLPAGMAGMRLTPFLLLTALGSTVWNFVLVFAGATMGDAWEQLLQYFDWYTGVAAVVIGAALLGGIYMLWKRRSNP